MILRLLMYVACVAAPSVVVATYVVRPLIRERRARRLGRLNADRTCLLASCGRYVDPDSRDAIFEDGHWMHRPCRRQLLS